MSVSVCICVAGLSSSGHWNRPLYVSLSSFDPQRPAWHTAQYGTATNIKSRTNRLSVLDAITSTQQRLKLYSKVPPNGLVRDHFSPPGACLPL